MTGVVTAIAAASLSQISLQAHIPRMRLLTVNLHTVREFMHPDLEGSSAYITGPDNEVFVAAFTTLLTALVPQLDRLGCHLSLAAPHSSIGTMEEDVFWELWQFLAASCFAFMDAISTWPGMVSAAQHDSIHTLYSIVSSLLAWLLAISRSSAWLSMQPLHGLESRNRQLMHMLALAVTFLDILFTVSPVVTLHHLSSAHPLYVPTLCCIASEQLTLRPLLALQAGTASASASATTYRQSHTVPFFGPFALNYFCFKLTSLINHVSMCCINTGCSKLSSLITDASVIQFVKGNLALPRETSSQAQILDTTSAVCLRTLLSYPTQPASEDDIVWNHNSLNAAGLNLCINPFRNKRCLEIDARVLHALSLIGADGNILLLEACYECQFLIAYAWVHADRLYLAPEAAATMMVSSMVGLSKHCLSTGLQLMTNAREVRIATVGQHTTGLQKSGPVGLHDIASNPSGVDSPAPVPAGRQQVCQLAHLVSTFRLQGFGGTLHSMSCEW